jgi:hypothetical protein
MRLRDVLRIAIRSHPAYRPAPPSAAEVGERLQLHRSRLVNGPDTRGRR